MFIVFLKAKLDIENKLRSLQKSYINIIRSSILPVETTYNKEFRLIEEKINALENIQIFYKHYLEQFRVVLSLLAEVKEVSEALESELDEFFEASNLEVPEDLVEKPFVEENIEQEKSINNFKKETKEEDEDLSDKENVKEDSDEYFSPNIQIRKSLKDNIESPTWCYTPALSCNDKF